MARFSSVLVRSTSTTCRSHALPTRVMIGAIESRSVRSCRSSWAIMPGPSRRAERGQGRVAQRVVLHRREELGVGRIRARPAALDDGHAERVEVVGDAQLVGHREVDADALRTVAQCRVVDLEAHDAAPLRAPRCRSASRATASATSSVPAAPPRSAVSTSSVMQTSTADLDGHGEIVAVQRVAEQHRDREDGAVGVGDAAPGEAWRAPVDRLVQSLVRRTEARRRQQTERAGEHRRLVAQDVAEEVLGDHDVDGRRARAPGASRTSRRARGSA